MYERFTDRARKVMQLAQHEAARFRHEYIGTEHVLLALMAEGSGVAAGVLKNLGIDLRKIRLEVERLLTPGPCEPFGRLPHLPRTTRMIEYARDESRNLNNQYVGTEHLLLGLLREQEGVATQVLIHFRLKIEVVREEVLNLLDGAPPDVGPVHVVVDALTTVLATPPIPPLPYPLTPEQTQLVRERVTLLHEQKERSVMEQDFGPAAECRDEADALTRLLAWYAWAKSRE